METYSLGPSTLLAALFSSIGFFSGLALGRRGRQQDAVRSDDRDAELARLQAQEKEQSRRVTRLLAEQRVQSNLARVLPGIARDLNSDNLDEREIPEKIFYLVRSVFDPEQAFLYLTWSSGPRGHEHDLLHFAGSMTSSEVPDALKTLRIGSGRIGWVADAKVEMQTDDWQNKFRTQGHAIDDAHPSLRCDLIGPLVQHDGEKRHLLGVLGIKNPGSQPSAPKLMLQMITNLATIAYTNSRNASKLRDLADHDGLTGLLNKRKFMGERLGLLINTAERAGTPLTLLVFDIDHFKKFNDTHGHLAGDEILKRVSDVVRENLRPADVACRYGGEEFIVAMPGVGGPLGVAAADRIRAAIEATSFPSAAASTGGRITISGGVAQFPVDGIDGHDLIRRADEALYQAKAAGRNTTVQFRGVDIGGDEPIWAPHADVQEDR